MHTWRDSADDVTKVSSLLNLAQKISDFLKSHCIHVALYSCVVFMTTTAGGAGRKSKNYSGKKLDTASQYEMTIQLTFERVHYVISTVTPSDPSSAATSVCVENSVCTNTWGSYTCSCVAGYYQLANGSCEYVCVCVCVCVYTYMPRSLPLLFCLPLFNFLSPPPPPGISKRITKVWWGLMRRYKVWRRINLALWQHPRHRLQM